MLQVLAVSWVASESSFVRLGCVFARRRRVTEPLAYFFHEQQKNRGLAIS